MSNYIFVQPVMFRVMAGGICLIREGDFQSKKLLRVCSEWPAEPPRIGGIFGGIRETLACDAPKTQIVEKIAKNRSICSKICRECELVAMRRKPAASGQMLDLDVAICKAYASRA
jgi:hypothetical protein